MYRILGLNVLIWLLALQLGFSQTIETRRDIPNSSIYSVIEDGGYFYVVGKAQARGSMKYSEGYIAKFDKKLNLVWEKTVGGTLLDQFSDVVLLDGKLYALGTSWRPSSAERKSDVWLVIFDTDGNMLNQIYLGGPEQDGGRDIALTPDGNLFITGYKTEGSNRDLWVIKLSPEGNVLWDKMFGTITDFDEGQRTCVLPDGYLVLGRKVKQGSNNSDPWILRLDANGQILWSRTFVLYEDNFFNNCVPLDKDFLLIGNSAIKKGGYNNIWLMRMTRDGSKVSDKLINSSMYEWVNAAVKDGNKIYLFGGLGPELQADYRIIDPDGNTILQNTLELPVIYSALKYKKKFVIVGGNKSNGYIALLK